MSLPRDKRPGVEDLKNRSWSGFFSPKSHGVQWTLSLYLINVFHIMLFIKYCN